MRWIVTFIAAILLPTIEEASAEARLVDSRESLYNNIYIVEDGDRVSMKFGKNSRYWTESVYDRSDPRALPIYYSRYMTITLAYPEKVDSILEIGLGGGRIAAYLNLHMPEIPILSVELDPDVIELAMQYFDLEPNDNFRIIERDGRIHLVRSPETHDIIMVDAYRGPFVPFHMLTKEFYETAKSRLKPGGVLAQNIEPSTMLFDAAIATLSGAFDNIDLYSARGNVVAIAYDGPQRSSSDILARARGLQKKHGFKYRLPTLLDRRRIVDEVPDIEPLVDDFAPVEMLKSVERHNQGIDAISRPASR